MSAGETYKFKIIAKNLVGESEASDEFAIIAATVPVAPDLPIEVSASQTQITIRWTAPDNGGSFITSYDVYYNDTGSFAHLASSTDLVNLQYTLNPATTGKFYAFKVTATNAVG